MEQEQKVYFDSKGDIIMSLDVANLMDTILIMLSIKPATKHEICLELRRCGFIITIPQTMKFIIQIKKDGYIIRDTDGLVSLN